MKLSKTLFVIPAATLVFAVAVGSGACSSSVSITIPTGADKTAPAGVVFTDGVIVGDACEGDVYVVDSAGDGWAFCNDGYWWYSSSDPSGDGYTVYSGGGSGDGGNGGSDTGTGGSDTGTGGSDTGTGGSDTGTGGGDTGTGGGDTGTGGGDAGGGGGGGDAA